MEKRFNFRIYPTKEQEIKIQKNFGCVRYVYNYYLRARIENYQNGQGIMSLSECCRDLTTLKQKEGHEWLSEADSNSLRYALSDLDDAYMAFFTKARSGTEPFGFPNYKKKRETRQSYRSKNHIQRQSIKVLDGQIKLPKLGYVECRVSKQIEGRILSATVIQAPSGKYFVSVCCTEYTPQPLPKTGAEIEIKAGTQGLAVISDGLDGRQHEGARPFDKAQKKLTRLQREMLRKPKGSNNREKARIKLARAFEKAANQKKDYLHKLTTQMVREYDVITIPATAQSRNTGWSEFAAQLEYKCNWYGKELIKTNANSA